MLQRNSQNLQSCGGLSTTSPNYPQSNGLSERSVQIVKNILIKSIASGNDFYLGLLNYRVTPRDGVSSPAELLMGRKLNTRLPTHLGKLKPSRNNEADYTSMLNKQLTDKAYYDRRSRPLPALPPGQPVLVADEGKRKYARVVSRADQPRSYFVSDYSGRRYRRNRRHLIKLENLSSDNNVSLSREFVSEDGEQWLSPQSDCGGDDNGDVIDANANVGPMTTTTRSPVAEVGRTPISSDPQTPRLRRPAAIKARKNLKDLMGYRK